jgi:putative transposase
MNACELAKSSFRGKAAMRPRKQAGPDEVSGRYTESCGEIFYSLKEAQIVIEQWRTHYNTIRLHSAINHKPPAPQTFAPLARHLDKVMPMQ